VLAAADSIDHYCAAWIQTGMDPEAAADRAVGLVAAQQGTCFGPDIARAITASREAIRSICGVPRRAPVESQTRQPVRSLPVEVRHARTATVAY
jgi:hypothetical protein